MPVPEIDVDELAARREAPGAAPVVLDVRQPDEYAEGHVPGAILVPLDQLPDRWREVPATGTVLVICRSGGRSAAAVDLLRSEGVDAVNVAGGTLAWVATGRAVATGDAPGAG